MMDNIQFKEPFEVKEIIAAEPGTSYEEEPGIEEKILCRNCHAHITDKAEEVSINESDYHLFKNPAGIYFRIVCFCNAPGCTIISDYTEKYTWFEGYSWLFIMPDMSFAPGWHYISLDRTFYGLIADRLTGI
jgi:hypothetical protein